jgi:2-keto-4-pentenoate hydratase/2-oxohepta-3-ene-1,7-dioic acid hydratase in catechol pathway
MRLATFTHRGRRRVGRVEGDTVVDSGVADMTALLAEGPPGLARVGASEGERLPLAEVRLLAPVPRPGKFLAVGLNYADHIAEMGAKTPDYPSCFAKLSTAINGPYDPVHRPRLSDSLDYEGELAFVIGRRCRHVPYERAAEVIAGYCICNDFTTRAWVRKTPQVVIPKSFDTHGPFGPWLTTPDEAGDPRNLQVRTWVNGELRQDSNTREMTFDCFRLVELLSQAVTFEPGDVVTTGTPPGVGEGKAPPHYLKPGDVVRVAIETLGAIENRIIDEPAETAVL